MAPIRVVLVVTLFVTSITVSFDWDFGDDSSDSDIAASNVFNGSGDLDVTLTVTDNDGATGTASTPVRSGVSAARITDGLVALYDFEEGSGATINDSSGSGLPLDLTIQSPASTTWVTGGIVIGSPTQISSGLPATKIYDALTASNSLTLEAWVRPASTAQDGPARIVSISESPLARNVTLGQGLSGSQPSDLFSVRLRTTSTNANGQPELISPSGSLGLDLTHVVFTRDSAGVGTLFIDGVEQASASVGGSFANWVNTSPLVLANEATGDRPWLGEFQLVAFYDRALTRTEVDQNFAAGPQIGGPIPNRAPTASFTASPVTGSVPLRVDVDASGSIDTDGSIVDYSWDFGDGMTDTGVTATHQFTSAGVFDIVLTVTDDSGATATANRTVVAGGQSKGDVPFSYIVVDPTPPVQAHVKALGDISGDGFLDIAVGGARDGDGLYWYEYPTWTKYTVVPPGTGFTTDMVIADVDNDGDNDIIVPKGYSRGTSVWWYENPSGTGDPRVDTWTERSIGAAPSHDVETADLDGNGLIDVVVRDGTTTLFLQTGLDTWQEVNLGNYPGEGIALGDIDRDGDTDIVVGAQWLENPLPAGSVTGAWTSRSIAPSWPDEAAAVIADINGDQLPDIALAPAETSGRLSWFEGPPDPKSVSAWTENVIDPSVEYIHQFEVADFDLDGDLDLAAAEMHQAQAPQNVSIYRNSGAGLGWTEQILATTGSHNIQAGDIGNDGDIDLVGVNWDGATPLELWQNELNPGGLDSWQRYVIDADYLTRAIFVTDADINSDGWDDIVAGSWWWENPGAINGNWQRRSVGSPMNQMATVYDFDGDGDLDILGTQGNGSTANNGFAWAENDGSGGFTIYTNIDSGVGDFLQGVTVARFNGPIQIVLSWHNSAGGLQALTVPADPVNDRWTWGQISPTSLDDGIDSGDIDGDGDLDLTLGLVWLRNDNTSWSEFTVYTPTTGKSDRVQLVDMDGDGDLDSLIGYEADPEGKLAWYENSGDPTALWPEHLIANLVNPQSIDFADLDGDGDIDVIAGEHRRFANEDPANATIFAMENLDSVGDTWRQNVIYVGDEHHDGAQLADFDNDGDLDIVSIGWMHTRLHVYENLRFPSTG